MRLLQVLTIGMGVLIVAGVLLLAVLLVGRFSASRGPAVAVRLDEPEGTRIVGLAAVRDRLALALSGGGADRVVVLDPVSLHVVGRIELAH